MFSSIIECIQRVSLCTPVFWGAMVLLPGVCSGASRPLTPAEQREVTNLRSEMASLRTRISVIESNHREALTAVAVAIDQIDRGFFIANSGGKAAKLLGFLSPLARVVSLGVKLSPKVAQAYDAISASLRAGRVTTTRRQLLEVRATLNDSLLDAVAPLLRRQREITARMNRLGVTNF